MIDKTYFVRHGSGDSEELFETLDKAIEWGQEQKLAPFTVFQLIAQPVRGVLGNGRRS